MAGTAVVVVVAVGKDDKLLFGCCVGTAAGPKAGAKGLGSGPNLTVPGA